MKNLLLIFLLISPITKLQAQDINDDSENISIEIVGGKTWDETDFHINIQKKGASVFIKYRLREHFDLAGIKKDTVYQALSARHKLAPANSAEKKALNETLLKMFHQHRPTYQDSITVAESPFNSYMPLLKHIAKADEKAFNEIAPGGMMDGDFLFCKITYQGKTRTINKTAPLSIESPLLYTFLSETFKTGRKAQLKTIFKIDEKFAYLF